MSQSVAPAPLAPVVVEEEVPPEEDGLDDQFSDLMSQAFSGGGGVSISKRHRKLGEGEQIKGKIVHIGKDNVFIDVGAKNEGYLSRREVEKDGELEVALGDYVEVYVVSVGHSGVELTRGLSQSSDARRSLEAAFSGGIPVEGKVTGKNKGGFEVTVMGERAFCPISQIEMAYTEDPDVHLNQTYRFLITKYEGAGKNVDVVLSRAELERSERAAKQEETFALLEIGQVRQGSVRKIMPFGVFVDLGGVDGLIHISELSWDRVDDPSTVVSPGETVTVKILNMKNAEEGPDKARIGLSLKAVAGDPWANLGETFQQDGVYEGEVVRIEHFGAFVQLAPGIDGLIHVSEMSLSRVRSPRDVVEVGQKLKVQVLSVDVLRKRLSLSIKSMEADPWDSANQRYPEGKEVEGVVENIEDFGVFVSLEPGVTALIPQSESATERGSDPRRSFRVGQTVTARVLSLELGRRRLTLTKRSPEEVAKSRQSSDGSGKARPGRRENVQPVQWKDESSIVGGMGTFADLFSKKLKR
jgi:small subunit ribosomal protein S1